MVDGRFILAGGVAVELGKLIFQFGHCVLTRFFVIAKSQGLHIILRQQARCIPFDFDENVPLNIIKFDINLLISNAQFTR